MKSNKAVNGMVATVIALTTAQAAFAQAAPGPAGSAQAAASQTVNEKGERMPVDITGYYDHVQKGTDERQKKVLNKINQALVSGSLSADQATDLKTSLNRINQDESWYKSLNKPIPGAVLSESNLALTTMEAELSRTPGISRVQSSPLQSDINEAINEALAKNRISSSTAEKYYMRLAQAESNLESIKRNDQDAGQTAPVQKDLAQLRAELKRL